MTIERFQPPIHSADELAGLIGTPSDLAIKKQRSELDQHMTAFIAESPFVLPVIGIGVEIEECFLQCAKALIRSKLWERPAEARPSSLPCFAQILVDQTQIAGQTVESLNSFIEESYAQRLY